MNFFPVFTLFNREFKSEKHQHIAGQTTHSASFLTKKPCFFVVCSVGYLRANARRQYSFLANA